jgi:hypothetical protein
MLLSVWPTLLRVERFHEFRHVLMNVLEMVLFVSTIGIRMPHLPDLKNRLYTGEEP